MKALFHRRSTDPEAILSHQNQKPQLRRQSSSFARMVSKVTEGSKERGVTAPRSDKVLKSRPFDDDNDQKKVEKQVGDQVEDDDSDFDIDQEDVPKLRLVGLKLKYRYTLPSNIEKTQTFAGYVVFNCRRMKSTRHRQRMLWKHRYMIASTNRLYFLKTPQDKEASLVFTIDDRVVDPRNMAGFGHSFRILPPVGTLRELVEGWEWMFVVETEAHKMAWVCALLKGVAWREQELAARGKVPKIVLQEIEDEPEPLYLTLSNPNRTTSPNSIAKYTDSPATSATDLYSFTTLQRKRSQSAQPALQSCRQDSSTSLQSNTTPTPKTLFPHPPPSENSIDSFHSKQGMDAITAHTDRFFRPAPVSVKSVRNENSKRPAIPAFQATPKGEPWEHSVTSVNTMVSGSGTLGRVGSLRRGRQSTAPATLLRSNSGQHNHVSLRQRMQSHQVRKAVRRVATEPRRQAGEVVERSRRRSSGSSTDSEDEEGKKEVVEREQRGVVVEEKKVRRRSTVH
ncbi:hypothetical protein HDV05_003496 [Chytridiales sp. JEL 0842]|nr:hypothetical protein HDV05_003496 [Chytridiales sp. JEL 0842]